MNISAIGYQPMSASKNLRQQNSTVNFRSKYSFMDKVLAPQAKTELPEALTKAREAARTKIAENRAQVAALKEKLASSPKNKEIMDQISKLEFETRSTIREFNEKLNDYFYSKYMTIKGFTHLYVG